MPKLLVIAIFLSWCTVMVSQVDIDSSNVTSHEMLEQEKLDTLCEVVPWYSTAGLYFNMTYKENRDPKKAVILSAILPGAGQLYNRQYYKVPIMYGAIGGVLYLFDTRVSNYRSFKKAYELRVANRDDEYPNFSQSQLKLNRDNARNKLEKTYLIAAGVYAYIVIDAYVSAHLSDFDVSDDLSFRIMPQDNMATGSIVGMGIGMTFRLQ